MGRPDMLRTGGSPWPTLAVMTSKLHVIRYLPDYLTILQYPYSDVDGCLAETPCGAWDSRGA